MRRVVPAFIGACSRCWTNTYARYADRGFGKHSRHSFQRGFYQGNKQLWKMRIEEIDESLQ